MLSTHHSRQPVNVRLGQARILIVAAVIALLALLVLPMSSGAADTTAVTLAPANQTVIVGGTAQVVATVTVNGKPVPGVAVTFNVTGVNSLSRIVGTDPQGQASLSYSSSQIGGDTVKATAIGITSNSAAIQWIKTAVANISLVPASINAAVGSAGSWTATVTDANSQPVPGVQVVFAVTGANAKGTTVAGTTDANGQVTISYVGAKAGADTIKAFTDVNGNQTFDSGEFSATTTASWVTPAAISLSPSAPSVPTGTSVTLRATVTDASNKPVQGAVVSFSVTGANPASGQATTDAKGQAGFSVKGSNAGTDMVDATVGGVSGPATATITWTSAAVVFEPAQPASPKSGCTYFAQTRHNLCAGFQSFWNQFGGLATYGYPLTEEFVENGMTVQYFERARFEWHPGAWPSRFDVELGLVGNEVTANRSSETPFMATTARSSADCSYYAETGHNLCAGFRAFWNAFGGLAVYGFPISEEFQEKNPDTGQIYTVQYFQRARFEWHPGQAPSRYDVELGRLGAQVLQQRYGVNIS